MKKQEVINFLTQANKWRRGVEGVEQPNPKELGEAIDFAIQFMEKVNIDMEVKKVLIECPICKETCDAEVVSMDYEPFSEYIHECEFCGHMITESEWEEVDK